jgi:hypothetical protein
MLRQIDQERLIVQRRRIENLLPGAYANSTIQNFFNNTADHLFQPEASQNINAYIGEIPAYYNPATDIYKIEPTLERGAYQLDPIMVSNDPTTGRCQ